MEKKDLKKFTKGQLINCTRAYKTNSTTKNWKMGKCKTQTRSTQEC